jgi:hypothetical protein
VRLRGCARGSSRHEPWARARLARRASLTGSVALSKSAPLESISSRLAKAAPISTRLGSPVALSTASLSIAQSVK